MTAQINSRPEVVTRVFAANGPIPNNRNLPLLVLKGAFAGGSPDPAFIEETYERNGWGGTWRAAVFTFHHYHPNSHEVLSCYSGGAQLVLGGPGGLEVALVPGDVLILPAGTGHCRISSNGGFSVVGGYPFGQEDYLLWRESPDQSDDAVAMIRAVPLPDTDPVYGAEGPLTRHWMEEVRRGDVH